MDIESLTREQLLEIVRRLPRTADGVPVTPGDTVWRGDPECATPCRMTCVPDPVTLGRSYHSTLAAAESAARAR